jgi:hypothetical protein
MASSEQSAWFLKPLNACNDHEDRNTPGQSDAMKSKTDIVLRIKSTVHIRWDAVDVVSAHRDVFTREGVVAVGKFGAPMPTSKCVKLAEQIKEGVETWLHLVFKKGDSFQGLRGRVKELFPASDERAASVKHPDYYARLQLKPSMWFVLSSQLEPYPLEHFRLQTNERSLLGVIKECRTTLMMVTEDAGKSNRPKHKVKATKQ